MFKYLIVIVFFYFQMEFMIIINVSELTELTKGLVLPRIMSNQLPRKCEVVWLVDYTGFKYKVAVQSIGRRSKRINGPEWIRFVETYKNKNIEKLCLKKLKEVKFEISVLNNEGLEIRKDASDRDYVHGWTTFCFENDIEESCQLLFQWMGNTPEDHFNGGTKHHYSHSNHRHRKKRPHYKKQFEYHIIETHNLGIPNKFDREHQLNEYRRAVLSFSHVKFLVQLLVRKDPRRPDDNTHLVMYSNSQRIMDEAGISMGKN
ncbi:hypothetical protein Hanom_Chr00s003348g01712101 [Helianthus anomalus]